MGGEVTEKQARLVPDRRVALRPVRQCQTKEGKLVEAKKGQRVMRMIQHAWFGNMIRLVKVNASHEQSCACNLVRGEMEHGHITKATFVANRTA